VTVRLADGTVLHREIEDHGRAVGVLPIDPARKVATLVEQLRPPMLVARGISTSCEIPAGLQEEDETPEACARREVIEECGLQIQDLQLVTTAWTMPGVSTEQISLFLGMYGETDRVSNGGGLDHEHENITVVEYPLATLAEMADAGTLTDMKTFLLVQTLRLRRPDLFSSAAVP
jgi:nudix-type nucleoside diphosphatase (YffH/AdpP family)